MKKPCKYCGEMLEAHKSERSNDWVVDCDDCCHSSVYPKEERSASDFDDLHPPRPTGYEKEWNRPF